MSDIKNVSVEAAGLNKDHSEEILAELTAAAKKEHGTTRVFTPVISGVSNTHRDEFELPPP